MSFKSCLRIHRLQHDKTCMYIVKKKESKLIVLQNCSYLELYNLVSYFRQTFKSDYEALKDRLRTLPDKLSHDVMVS